MVGQLKEMNDKGEYLKTWFTGKLELHGLNLFTTHYAWSCKKITLEKERERGWYGIKKG